MDALLISYDVSSILWDLYQIQQMTCACQSESLYRQLAIDSGALLLDMTFLLLPGMTGGGPMLRLALAGGGHAVVGAARVGRAARMGYRGVQAGYKGAQVGAKIAYFASKGKGSNAGIPSYIQKWYKQTSKLSQTEKMQRLQTLEKTLLEHEKKYREVLLRGGRSQEVERLRQQVDLLREMLGLSPD